MSEKAREVLARALWFELRGNSLGSDFMFAVDDAETLLAALVAEGFRVSGPNEVVVDRERLRRINADAASWVAYCVINKVQTPTNTGDAYPLFESSELNPLPEQSRPKVVYHHDDPHDDRPYGMVDFDYE